MATASSDALYEGVSLSGAAPKANRRRELGSRLLRRDTVTPRVWLVRRGGASATTGGTTEGGGNDTGPRFGAYPGQHRYTVRTSYV